MHLVHNFNKRVVMIALVCILLAGVIALPIARFIFRPIDDLVQANRRLAEGDMGVRVRAPGHRAWRGRERGALGSHPG